MIEENIVTNVCLWDGDVNSWQPPQDATMLVQATTPAFNWAWNPDLKDFELIESLGTGGVGFTWNGTACITNQPKPVLPTPASDQPDSSGTVTI